MPRFHSLPTRGLLTCVRLRHGSKKMDKPSRGVGETTKTVLAGERLPENKLSVTTCPFALNCLRKRRQRWCCWQRRQRWERGFDLWANPQVVIHFTLFCQTQFFNLRILRWLFMSLRPNSLSVDCAKHSLDFTVSFVEVQRTISNVLYVVHTVIRIV